MLQSIKEPSRADSHTQQSSARLPRYVGNSSKYTASLLFQSARAVIRFAGCCLRCGCTGLSTNLAKSAVPLIVQVLYISTKLIYNIYLHPLAKFPGPKASSATDIIYWYHWCTGTVHTYIANIHARYGEVVRIAPNRLSFIDPQGWKDIYGHHNASKSGHVHKEHNVYQPDHNGRHSVLSKFDDQEHARVRKIFSNAFSDRALKAQESLIQEHVNKFIGVIVRKSSETPNAPIDAVKLLNCLTFDIIGDLAFGESLGLLERGEYNWWVETIFNGFKNLAITTVLLEYPLIGAIMSFFVPKSLKEVKAKVYEFSSTRVEKRMAKGAVIEKPDFWSLALAQHDKGAIDLEDMKTNAGVFMVAGSETTATALSGLFYNLLMNPEKLKKLVKEVRESIKSEDDLTLENIQSLKYLVACFDESMRGRRQLTCWEIHPRFRIAKNHVVYPSVSLGPPRVMDSDGGIVSGHFVPKDVSFQHAIQDLYQHSLISCRLASAWHNGRPIILPSTSRIQMNLFPSDGLPMIRSRRIMRTTGRPCSNLSHMVPETA